MLKIAFSLIVVSPKAPPRDVTVYGPDPAGRYAVPGEGFLPTRSCTVTADGMRARVAGRFITFLDRHGREEGQCEIGERPTVERQEETIRRAIGTVAP